MPADDADGVPAAIADDDSDGVDVTLIRWMPSLSPEERLDVLQGFVDCVELLVEALLPRQVLRAIITR